MNKETETGHLPSEKKRKFTKKDAGGQQTSIKKVKGIQGVLEVVKGMPLDILFEIFSHLDPIDLVTLTQTSKELRAMLTSRSSTSVWKAARANIVPAMPDCPDDLSEPQYAVLMFGKGCHHCGRNLASIRTVWLARRRICKRCIDEHCSLSFPDEYMRNIVPLKRYLPKIEVSRKPSTYYFVEYATLWQETHNNIADPKEKESWIISKCEERKAVNAHALLCATWVDEFAKYQKFLVEQLTKRRVDDIAKRVADLGWDEEVRKMVPSEKKFEEQSYIQDMCQKKLTDRIWVSLDDHINAYMERIKNGRLKRERLAFLGDRLPILQKVHNDYLLKEPIPERYWYPMASELFLYEPKIQDIINDTSSTLKSMKEQLTLTLPKIYPDAIEQLCERMHNQFLEIIVASRPGEVINTDWDFYELATTIFECSNCDKSSKRILRYDEAMLHSCTRKYDFPAGCQDSYFIEKFLGEKYRSHNRLTVSKTALKLVPILARLCGLNPPRTATSQMMDYHNPIFECIPCGSPGLGRATMTWLGAVFHFSNKEHDFDMEDWMKFRRLNVNEEDVARRRIIEMRERAIASVSDRANPLIQCAHCSENASKAKLMAHVKSAHGIKNPTDKDIMLNVDANHIPDIFYMWPPRKPEQHQE